jgi:hypothetical protein
LQYRVSTDESSLLAACDLNALEISVNTKIRQKPLLELLNWDQDFSVPDASTDSYVDIEAPRRLSRLNKSVEHYPIASSDTRAARYQVRNGRHLEVKSFSCTVPLWPRYGRMNIQRKPIDLKGLNHHPQMSLSLFHG